MCNDPQFHFLVVFNFQLAFFLGIHSCKAGSFDGQGGIIAHALYPEQRSPFKSFVHFDGDEQWTVSDGTSNKYSLLPVALHEIGHVLGLAHSNHTKAVMYRSYNKKSSSIQLDDDDVDGIQEKYGAFNYFYLFQVRITGRAGNVQFNPRDMWILQKVNFRPIKRLKWNNRKLVSREVRKIYSVLSRENSTVFSIDCFKAVALGLDDFLNKRLNGRTCQELDFRLSQPLKIFQLKFIYPGHRPKLPSLSIILSCLYLFAVLLGAGLGGEGGVLRRSVRASASLVGGERSVWPGFKFRRPRYVFVEFLVGPSFCPRGFSPQGTQVFIPLLENHEHIQIPILPAIVGEERQCSWTGLSTKNKKKH